MTDQLRITHHGQYTSSNDGNERCGVCGLPLDDHWLASCPDVAGDSVERTWDGEQLWSVETQQDELFAGDAFKQMPGQLPIEERCLGFNDHCNCEHCEPNHG